MIVKSERKHVRNSPASAQVKKEEDEALEKSNRYGLTLPENSSEVPVLQNVPHTPNIGKIRMFL